MDIKERIKSIERMGTRGLIEINIIGFILSAVAGWINAVGISLFLNGGPSFMSGKALLLGSFILKGDVKAFMDLGLIIISFIVGACISTIITRRKGLGAGLLLAGSLITLSSFPFALKSLVLDTIIISMAMGCQNAATSLTALNRTTHLTGPATDIGMNIAKGNWNRVTFWTLRWISFPIGAAIGFMLVEMFYKNIISLSFTLLLPGVFIIGISVLQEFFLHIPLLEEEIEREEILNQVEINIKDLS